MSLEPLLSAPLHIQIHAAAALTAVFLGPVPLYRKKRDRLHKVTGYVWVVAMFTTALSAFFIHSFAVIGPFSPLHGFALLTFWTLFEGMRHIFAGRIKEHRASFRSLYWYGLMIAGLANFMPDRRINEALFGGNDGVGWIAIAIGGTAIASVAIRQRKGAPMVAA